MFSTCDKSDLVGTGGHDETEKAVVKPVIVKSKNSHVGHP